MSSWTRKPSITWRPAPKPSRSIPAIKMSKFRSAHITKSIQSQALKRSQFRSMRYKIHFLAGKHKKQIIAHQPIQLRSKRQNHVSFGHPHKLNAIPIHTLNPGRFWSPTLKSRMFRPLTQTPSHRSGPTQNSWLFQPPKQTPSKSIPTLNPSHFLTAPKLQVKSDPHTHTSSLLSHTLKPLALPARTQKPNQFWLRHKTESIPTPTQEPSNFLPPQRNKVNSDPYTDIQSFSIRHTEIKPIPTTHTIQVYFGAHTKHKSFGTVCTIIKSISNTH